MKVNKRIDRDGQAATKIFDNRRLKVDYRTLIPILKKGMLVLDVGCGTGSISRDIANIIGDAGKVIGIDTTEQFIKSGKETYKATLNLELVNNSADQKPNLCCLEFEIKLSELSIGIGPFVIGLCKVVMLVVV